MPLIGVLFFTWIIGSSIWVAHKYPENRMFSVYVLAILLVLVLYFSVFYADLHPANEF